MKLSHLDEKGNAHMVDVGAKEETSREAVASGRILMKPEVIERLISGDIPKGDVLAVSRVAGIMGAKQTASLIPMCHPLFIHSCRVDFDIRQSEAAVIATATVGTSGKTGVEMEALTAVSVALLAVYDMCKALDKSMVIEDIRLLKKTGGKSGTYERED